MFCVSVGSLCDLICKTCVPCLLLIQMSSVHVFLISLELKFHCEWNLSCSYMKSNIYIYIYNQRKGLLCHDWRKKIGMIMNDIVILQNFPTILYKIQVHLKKLLIQFLSQCRNFSCFERKFLI